MKIRLLFVLLLLLGMCSVVGVVKGQELRSDSVDSLAAGFGTPPDSAKLWAYWWWLNGNVDKESITKDLTEMYKQGFGGALLCDAGGASQDGNDNVPAGAMFGSPEWRELYKHALNEAAKLGMSVSLNIQSGWNLGGPDVKPENATKVVVWSETKFNTADQNAPPTELLLPQPKTNHNFYQDIAVVAVRTKSIDETKNDPDKTATATAQSSQKNFPPELAVDGNPETFWVSSGTEAGKGPSKEASESFALFFPKVIKATGIAITPRAGYGPDSCALFVAENDPKEINYKPIKFFNVKKEGETIISFDSVAGNIFQLVIFSAFDPNYPNAPRNVQIAEIELLDGNTRFGKSIVKNNPKPLNHLGAKIAIKELGGSAPNCDYLVEDEEELESDEEHIVKAWFVSEKNENGDIRFIASLGEGDWSVLRFGYTCTGARVSTASGKWQGLVVDYLDADAFDIYWKNNVQPLIDDAGSLAGKTLRYLHTDSWELGGVNWTKTMRDEFKKRRGYDVIEYLPILAGKIIKNREVSNRFLFDFRRTIGDLIADNHYGRMKAKGREFGIGVHPESGGPHAAPIDSLQLLGMSDIPMSEYWSWSPRHRVGDPNRFFIKQPASAAHTHGKRLVAAEGFTNIGMHWQESFADNLKPAFDQSICEGCNLLVWHAFTASPKSAGLPGQEYFAGTHFNPQHTCWNYSADFLSYINRSQFLMQQGLYAADVVQYYGDNVPNFTQGEWNNTAKSLPDYAYDVASMDAVLKMKVYDGRIFLPDGMNYKILVLPEVSGINLDVLQKVRSLINDGATVIGSRPKRISNLNSYINLNDNNLKSWVDGHWGTDDVSPKIRQVGKGRIITGMTAAEVLRQDKLPPDVKRLTGTLPDNQHRIKWIHRTLHNSEIFGGKTTTLSPVNTATTPETTPQVALDNTNRTEIYFVANLVAQTDKTEIAFRVTQKQPELWNPLNGTITDAKSFRQENGQTIVPLEFAPNGSIFVVFRKPIAEDARGVANDNSLQFEQLLTLNENWAVTFISPFDQADIMAKFPKLIDWTKHDNDEIKYHSGKAIYYKEFSYKKDKNKSENQRIYLDLGLVREMVKVRLNGKDLGTLWARPFEVEVTDTIQDGYNILVLEVVNHWANRIIGDSQLPESQRKTKTNIRKLNSQTPLLESGLIGTVQLKTVKNY